MHLVNENQQQRNPKLLKKSLNQCDINPYGLQIRSSSRFSTFHFVVLIQNINLKYKEPICEWTTDPFYGSTLFNEVITMYSIHLT